MAPANHPDSVATPAQLLLREVWSRGDLALVEELVTDDFVCHDPVLTGPIRGPAALVQAVARCRRGSTDLTKAVETTFVDGDTVVVPYTATGTHEGPLLGIEATGRAFEVDGVFIARVADGRLAEGTDLWDAYGLLDQLGALPTSHTDRDDSRQP